MYIKSERVQNVNRGRNVGFVGFGRPPKALLRARLDNIAIVPASMLPFKESWQKVANRLPEGGVFLMTAKENGRQASHALILQKGILERVGEFWRGRGHTL